MHVRRYWIHLLGITKQVFTPATPDEIAKYRDEAYTQWLEQCEQVLRQYHFLLQEEIPAMEFSFLAQNVGSRPATDALITIEACGSFQIMPPPFVDNDGQPNGDADEAQEPQPRKLSSPPDPPTGRWQTTMGLDDLDQVGRSLRQMVVGSRNLEMLINPPFVLPSPVVHTPHDPNAFYYKPNRPSMPQESFSFECDQWRHGNEEEPFFGEIHVSPDQDAAKGALVCRIQASNLSKSVSKNISVRITVAHVSAFESAQTIVERLLELHSPRPD